MLSDVDLEVKPLESEVSKASCDNFQSVIIAIQSARPGITVTKREDLDILGAPTDINGLCAGVPRAVSTVQQCPTGWNQSTHTLHSSSSGITF